MQILIYRAVGASPKSSLPFWGRWISRKHVGNRYMLCYTGKNRAIYDTDVSLYPENAGIYHLPVHDMLNNVFNKRTIGGLVFNRYLGDQSIIVRKSVLERLMPGEKPLPPNFKDAPE